MPSTPSYLHEAFDHLKLAISDLETLASDGRLTAIQMHNDTTVHDWIGTALSNAITCQHRLISLSDHLSSLSAAPVHCNQEPL